MCLAKKYAFQTDIVIMLLEVISRFYPSCLSLDIYVLTTTYHKHRVVTHYVTVFTITC